MKIAGMGGDNLRLIDVDENFAMRPEALSRQIQQDQQRGPGSLLRVRHGGNHVVERHRSRARDRPHLPRARNLWLHVDAAMCRHGGAVP